MRRRKRWRRRRFEIDNGIYSNTEEIRRQAIREIQEETQTLRQKKNRNTDRQITETQRQKKKYTREEKRREEKRREDTA